MYAAYRAPFAAVPRVSVEPRLAATNARPVTQAGGECPARKKSRLVCTERRAAKYERPRWGSLFDCDVDSREDLWFVVFSSVG